MVWVNPDMAREVQRSGEKRPPAEEGEEIENQDRAFYEAGGSMIGGSSIAQSADSGTERAARPLRAPCCCEWACARDGELIPDSSARVGDANSLRIFSLIERSRPQM